MIDLWNDNSDWSEQEAADFILPQKPQLVESQRLPPLAYLILETQQGKSPILREWVEKVLPGILTNLCLTHAKGMSRAELQRNDFLSPTMAKEKREKAIRTLEAMPVQSLSVHVMNAALSAWTVVELANLSEDEQRLYLAGVTMHDLNKMVEREVAQGLKLEGEKTELYKTQFTQWGQALGLWSFIEESRWQDVAFLAHNAEAVRGENRTLANYTRAAN